MKACRNCGIALIKPRSVSHAKFAARQYCSTRCHRTHRHVPSDRGQEPQLVVMPARHHPAYGAMWKIKNPEKMDRYRKRIPDYHRKTNYGITPERFLAMRLEQDDKCAICAEPLHFADRTGCHVDHDHESGKVRALLCSGCNAGLGNYKEDPDRLHRAIAYLEKHAR